MLRGRWNEVVERLSSISRVTWSMVGGNAQLGAVDGSRVVLLFPVEAMVNAFSRGPARPTSKRPSTRSPA